jgi:hypothetical protein
VPRKISSNIFASVTKSQGSVKHKSPPQLDLRRAFMKICSPEGFSLKRIPLNEVKKPDFLGES